MLLASLGAEKNVPLNLSSLPTTPLTLPHTLELAKTFYNKSRPKITVQIIESALASLSLDPCESLASSSPPSTIYALNDYLAAAYHASDFLKESERIYSCLHRFNPNDATVLLNLAIVLFSDGEFDKSREVYVTIEKMLNAGASGGSATLALVLHERGHLEFESGAIDVAERYFSNSLKMKKLIIFSQQLDSGALSIDETLLRLGMIEMEEARFKRAEEYLSEASWRNENNVDVIAKLQEAKAGPRRNNNVIVKRGLKTATTVRAVKYVTFASDPTKCELQRLLDSAKFNSIEIQVLGQNVKNWKNGNKLKLLKEFTDTMCSENDLVVIVDGYDVVISGSEEEFVERWGDLVEGTGTVVFQADYTFYCPLHNNTISTSMAKNYPTAPTMYRYLSSGGIMGRAKDVSALVGEVLEQYGGGEEWEMKSDQSLFIRWLVDNKGGGGGLKIVVDHFQMLFSGNGGRSRNKDFDVVGGKLHNVVTDSFPVMMHAPGRQRFQREFYELKEKGWELDFRKCK